MPRLAAAAYVNHWTSAVGALCGVLSAQGTILATHEVSALSGHAFRFALTAGPDEMLTAGGPCCFTAESALPLYEALGMRFRAFEAGVGTREYEQTRHTALEQMRRSTEHGRPVIAFGLHTPEFGIVRGVDRDSLIVSSTMSAQYGERLPASQWPPPGGVLPVRIFVADKAVKFRRREAAARALAFAVHYARDGESGVVPGCHAVATGLDAFRRWTALLAGNAAISASGQAFCIQALLQARRDASQFLLAEAALEQSDRFRPAAELYQAVALELSRLASIFPYPNGGDVRSVGGRRAGALYAARTLAAEERAVEALEQAIAG